MQRRLLGRSAIEVTALGLGTGQIGGDDVDDKAAFALLAAALDAGITLWDSARSYGCAEERIGRFLAGRRQRPTISTKCGYGIEGCEDWTGPCITRGVDAALGRLGLDRIDLMHLHSCPRSVLERDDVMRAVEDARAGGKVALWGYSGENEALDHAVRTGVFDVVQASLNLCDQRVIGGGLALAAERGLGFIAKRPLANAPWRFRERPTGDYAETYWERLRAMALDPQPFAWDELALRFSAHTPGVSTAIVGTKSVDHLRRAAEVVARGPLPPDVARRLRETFARHGAGWEGQV
jgi:aryl-alcohol dehydrogenase-like predicted oxidoreductase